MNRLTTRLANALSGWSPLLAAAAPALFVWRQGARPGLALAIIAMGILIVIVARMVSARVSQRRTFIERVLILGTGPLAATLVEEIEARDGPYVVAGIVGEAGGAGPELEGVTLVGTLDALEEIIGEVLPGVIVMALTDRPRRVLDALLLDARMRGVVVEDAVTFLERLTGKLAIERITPRSIILSQGFRHSAVGPLAALSQSMMRTANVTTAAIGLAALSPLLCLIALWLKLDSPGPVFFVQARVGLGGRPFGIIKFRTMRQDAVHTSEWVCDNTDRITRAGRWLRRFRLDELPQLFNVFRGDMNLVGPRPHPMSNYLWFLDRIPFYRLRAAVRPGITGWAQVRYGYANNLEEEIEKMRYDLYYIKHRSAWLDLRILLETVALVLRGSHSHSACGVRSAVRTWPDMWPGAPSRVSWR